jgi:GNAT superfamily N-acetyltransferase
VSTCPEFTLRPPIPSDASLFYYVIDKTMRSLIIATWGAWDEERVQREATEFAQSTNGQVIHIGDAAAGILVVVRESTQIWLRQLYLLPEYQGKGIGTRLAKDLLMEGTRAKVPIRLRVLALNPALAFYVKLGFDITETTPDLVDMECRT